MEYFDLQLQQAKQLLLVTICLSLKHSPRIVRKVPLRSDCLITVALGYPSVERMHGEIGSVRTSRVANSVGRMGQN
jgi:hypothetical protein